jgi:tripartite-type tricarboxylate transporter receptor subunit TctC
VSLYKNLGYDPEKDFEPITVIGTQTNVLYTHPSVPAKSLGELIDYARANPGKLTFGSGGIGTPAHLAGELLKMEAKLEMTHVPFRGTGPALQAVIGGHVPMAYNPPPPLLPHLQSGTIRALAITTLQRTAALPEVPTIAESGVKGFEASSWFGLLAPAGTPADIVSRIQQESAKALGTPALKERLLAQGAIPSGMPPAEFAAFIAAETKKWEQVVKLSGAKVD